MPDHRLGLTSLTEEVGPVELALSGRPPPWLSGALLRTGPALFEVGGSRYQHWFDGLAMLYRLAFADGRVRYTNRFLHSRAFEAARTGQRIAYGEFGTAPDRSLTETVARLVRGMTTSQNANVSITQRPEGVFALTETPVPVQFDPETLETIGPRPFSDDQDGQVTTAHPHTDPERQVQVNYLLQIGRRSAIHVLEHPLAGGPRRRIASVPVAEPAYMHTFGMTGRHVVLVEPPFRASPLSMRFGLKPFIGHYRWRTGEPTRFHLVDRASGSVVTVEGEPCFAFHQTNAFDDGDAVMIDLCAYPDAGIVGGLELDRLRSPQAGGLARSRLLRYRLPKRGGTARMEEVCAEPVELPRINDAAVAGRHYRQLWVASSSGPDSGFLDRILRIDTENGACAAVWGQKGCFAGEPLFVPRPGSDREAEGIILSLILDTSRGRSALLMLEAESLEEVARADLPHVVPFHFHGRHVAGPGLSATAM